MICTILSNPPTLRIRNPVAAVAAGKQVTRATKKREGGVEKCHPKLSRFGFNMGPTWVPNFSKIAPGMLPDGL